MSDDRIRFSFVPEMIPEDLLKELDSITSPKRRASRVRNLIIAGYWAERLTKGDRIPALSVAMANTADDESFNNPPERSTKPVASEGKPKSNFSPEDLDDIFSGSNFLIAPAD